LVAASGALDLYHVRPKISEQHPADGTRHCLRQVQNTNVAEHTIHAILNYSV
jgi:hypothetical protein